MINWTLTEHLQFHVPTSKGVATRICATDVRCISQFLALLEQSYRLKSYHQGASNDIVWLQWDVFREDTT